MVIASAKQNHVSCMECLFWSSIVNLDSFFLDNGKQKEILEVWAYVYPLQGMATFILLPTKNRV